ncbi:hypothetical protein [Thalassotalea agarivorans]|uniref:Uncharacterized protein n=1 Tax=Thalassotalea agarivorans TaxID=349064 RepID=A0A1I0E6A2_THASX|nr:hypothetical protein [Thalassotalea agarivorans]SET40524.1 hypothetical protein SAMN05660429_01741 [Thalassotalea agarivorans]
MVGRINKNLFALDEVNFFSVILVLFLVHVLCACIVFVLILKRIDGLKKLKRNKYIVAHIDRLESYKLLVLVLPVIGPIIGWAISNGLDTGITETGLKVNDSGGTSADFDSE